MLHWERNTVKSLTVIGDNTVCGSQQSETRTLTGAVLRQGLLSAHLKLLWRFPHSENEDYLFHQRWQFQIQIQEPKVVITINTAIEDKNNSYTISYNLK